MSVHWGGNGMAELGERSIVAGSKARAARDRRPEESAVALLAMVRGWLAARGKASTQMPDRLPVAIVAAEQLLRALDVRPSTAVGGRTHNPPAAAGPAGTEEEGTFS